MMTIPFTQLIHRNDRLTLIGLMLLAGIGNLSLSLHPFIVGGAIDFLGFSAARAGHLAAVEMAGFALGSFTASLRIHVWNRQWVGAIGAILVIGGNLLSCFLTTYEPLLVTRTISGLGSAFALSVFSSTAAATPNPVRTFGIVNSTSIGGSGVLIWIAGYIIAAWGLPGIFLSIVGLTIVFSIGIFTLPARVDTTIDLERATMYEPVVSKFQAKIGIPMCLGLMLFMFIGQYAIWAYQERIGVGIGMESQEIGFWIGAGRLIFGTAASLLASYIGLRIGRIWPQVISITGCIFGVSIVVFGTTPFTFAFGSTLLTTAMFYGLAYQQGLLSGFDRKGRANVAGDMMGTIGMALGPLMVSFLVAEGGYQVVGWLSSGILLIALALALPPAIMLNRLDKKSGARGRQR